MDARTKAFIVKGVIGVLSLIAFGFIAIAFVKGERTVPMVYGLIGIAGAVSAIFKLTDEQLVVAGIFLLGLILVIPGPVAFGLYAILAVPFPELPMWPFAILTIFTTILGVVLIVKAVKSFNANKKKTV